jgi:guanine deaminase
MVYQSDAIVGMANGLITHFGPAAEILPQLPTGTEVKDYSNNSLISAGFVDSHVHFPQTPMIAAYGEQLLDWLNKYTFPTEQKYSDKEFARSKWSDMIRRRKLPVIVGIVDPGGRLCTVDALADR